MPLDTLAAVELAVIVVVPAPAAVTGTVAVVAFAAIVTDEGNDTTPEILELRFTVRAEGAGAERVTVRFCVTGPVSVTGVGDSVSFAPTVTA